jgi:hypothetical protein
MRKLRSGLVLAICSAACSFVLVGCDPLMSRVCTEQAVSGLTVQVRDSVTNQPLGSGSIVTARDGAYSETLASYAAGDELIFYGAVERAGSYLVTVTHPGYQPWQHADVTVSSGSCHVIPVQVQARLQRIP